MQTITIGQSASAGSNHWDNSIHAISVARRSYITFLCGLSVRSAYPECPLLSCMGSGMITDPTPKPFALMGTEDPTHCLLTLKVLMLNRMHARQGQPLPPSGNLTME